MNRAEEFRNTEFNNRLNNIKATIKKIDKLTILNAETLKSFNRYKKVIKYIESYIELVDFDLLTEKELSNLRSMADSGDLYWSFERLNYCIRDDFNGKWEHYIKEANIHIDNCLPTIKNIFPKFILPKQSIKNVFEEYNKTIQEHLNKIDFDNSVKASTQIQEILENEKIERINNFFDKIYQGDDKNKSLERKKDDIYKDIEEIKNKIQESSNKQVELNNYYTKIFGEFDEGTEERKGGLKKEIDSRKEELNNFKQEQEKVLNTLKDQIKGLMPNAVSVGLAKAFSDEKKNFKKAIKKWNWGFIGCISTLVVFSFIKLFWLEVDFTTLQSSLNFVLSGLPIILPLVWLAIYCAKRRSENSMLLQEYTHKETFANSYSSYKNQIEDLKEEDRTLLNELLRKAIAIISKNPTTVLGKNHSGDLPVDEIQKTAKEVVKTVNSRS